MEQPSDKQSFKTIWLGVMIGLLVAYSPKWLSPDYHSPVTYDAPWVYPQK